MWLSYISLKTIYSKCNFQCLFFLISSTSAAPFVRLSSSSTLHHRVFLNGIIWQWHHNYTSQDVLYRHKKKSMLHCCACYSIKSQAFGFVGSTKQNQHLFNWNLLQNLLQCTDTLFIRVWYSAIVCLNAGTAAIKTPDKQEKDESIIYLVCSPFILYFSLKSELGENKFHCQKVLLVANEQIVLWLLCVSEVFLKRK